MKVDVCLKSQTTVTLHFLTGHPGAIGTAGSHVFRAPNAYAESSRPAPKETVFMTNPQTEVAAGAGVVVCNLTPPGLAREAATGRGEEEG